MELRQLVYFDAVVRHGGFTRAAEQLHVAQPAISAQIRQLEKELGVRLLERTTRRQALTQAGELFWGRVGTILGQVDAARAELEQLSSVLQGRVRIGATPAVGPLDLPAALASFRRRHPGVTLVLRSDLVTRLVEQLDAGDLDLVVGPEHTDLPKRYRARRIAPETLVLALPPGHRLTTVRDLRLADTATESFVCLPAGSGLHGLLSRAATAAGFTPRIDFETHSPTSIRELVAAGLGLALLPASASSGPGPRVEVRRPADLPAHPPIAIIDTGGRASPPAVRAFVRYLRLAAGGSAPAAAGAGLAPRAGHRTAST